MTTTKLFRVIPIVIILGCSASHVFGALHDTNDEITNRYVIPVKNNVMLKNRITVYDFGYHPLEFFQRTISMHDNKTNMVYSLDIKYDSFKEASLLVYGKCDKDGNDVGFTGKEIMFILGLNFPDELENNFETDETPYGDIEYHHKFKPEGFILLRNNSRMVFYMDYDRIRGK